MTANSSNTPVENRFSIRQNSGIDNSLYVEDVPHNVKSHFKADAHDFASVKDVKQASYVLHEQRHSKNIEKIDNITETESQIPDIGAVQGAVQSMGVRVNNIAQAVAQHISSEEQVPSDQIYGYVPELRRTIQQLEGSLQALSVLFNTAINESDVSSEIPESKDIVKNHESV